MVQKQQPYDGYVSRGACNHERLRHEIVVQIRKCAPAQQKLDHARSAELRREKEGRDGVRSALAA